jgi:hypothetical protein
MIVDGKYSLEVISRDSDSKGRRFKEHRLDDNSVIGVFENEPFLIRFKNLTGKKVQVRISVDGTDVLTGKLAHTQPTNDGMWVVQAFGSMELKAWPEDNQGGAEFLFTHTEDSVAANTHGDTSSKGIIAVAVFEEDNAFGYLMLKHEEHHHHLYPKYYDYWWNKTNIIGTGQGGGTYSSNRTGQPDSRMSKSDSNTKGITSQRRSIDFSNNATSNMDEIKCCVDLCSDSVAEPQEMSLGVGAGDFVNQNITKAAGLNAPKLGMVLRIKYEYWASLRSKLRKQASEVETNGFPGDKQKLIDLGNTPRLETTSGRRRRFRKEAAEKKNRTRKNKRRLRPEEKYVEYQRFM